MKTGSKESNRRGKKSIRTVMLRPDWPELNSGLDICKYSLEVLRPREYVCIGQRSRQSPVDSVLGAYV